MAYTDENAKDARPTVEGLQRLLEPEMAMGQTGQQQNQCEIAREPAKVMVALTPQAADTLRCLFFHGPTWDGNVPSKTGRDELVNMNMVQRGKGWQWFTRAGIDACFANGIHDEKERRESRERGRRHRLEEAIRDLYHQVF
jgi:hypothetical protein